MPKYKGTHSRRSSTGKRFRIVLFSCFLMIFLLSLSMVLKNVIEYSKAKNDYSELQTLVRQKDNTVSPKTNEASSSAANGTELSHTDAAEKTAAETAEEAEELIQQKKISMDFSQLKEINPEIIGWIHAEGTNIDYPIAQTDNNDYYLNHLYNKQWNSSGTVFVDYRNTENFFDKNTVLYGHHMNNGTMFHDLDNYKKQEFYDTYPTMTLYTPDGDYTIELFCGTVEDGNYQFVEFNFDSEEDFLQYLEKFRARSTFVSDVVIQPDDRILSLCTCSYERTNARFMVIGRMVPVMETVN